MYTKWVTSKGGFSISHRQPPDELKKYPLFREFETTGTFWLPNKPGYSRAGILKFKPGQGLLIVIDDLPWCDSARSGIKIEVIQGQLADGAKCTIFNCRASIVTYVREREYYRSTIHGEHIIFGQPFSGLQDLVLADLRCEFTHLNEWCNNPYQVKHKRDLRRSLVSFSPDEFKVDLETEGVSFQLELFCAHSIPWEISNEGRNWTYNYCLLIRPKEPQNFQWFLSTASKLRGCLMFLIGAAIYTLDLVASFPKDPASNDVSCGQILQAVDVPSAIDGDRFDFSTRLEEIAEQLPQILKAWFNRSVELKVVMNTYKEILLNDGSYEESLFLRIVQALEHFHGVIFPSDTRYFPKKYWKLFYEWMQTNVPQGLRNIGINDKGKVEILLNRLSFLNELSFSSRMRQLLAEIPGPDLMPLLNNPDNRENGINEFVRKIDRTRNFLIHHEKKHAKDALMGHKLQSAISSCWAILSYWLARNLGFSERIAADISYKAHFSIFHVGRKSAL